MPRPSPGARYPFLLIVPALFALLAVVFTWPIYRDVQRWGIQDWDVFTFFSATPRVTIQAYGQFPLWNPWFCGGMPLLGRPESPFLTPFFLINLLFGDIVGMKLQVTVSLWVGLCGMYALARQFGMGRTAAVLAAIVFMLGGPYTMHMTVGNTNQMFMSFMPWMLFFYRRAVGGAGDVTGNLKLVTGGGGKLGEAARVSRFELPVTSYGSTLACALCLEVMWLGGCPYQLSMGLLLLGVYSLLAVVTRAQALWRTAGVLAGVVVLVVGIGAIKFFPSIAFTVQYPRLHNLYCGFSLESLWHGLLGRDQSLASVSALSHAEGFVRGVTHGMNEIGTYVGVLPLLLFVAGVVTRARRQLVLLLCFVFFLWLSFGVRAPVSAWTLLHKLPVFNIMRVAERFNMIFLLPLAIFAGLGLEAVGAAVRRLAGRARGANRSPQAEPLQGGELRVGMGVEGGNRSPRAEPLQGGLLTAAIVVAVFVDLMLVVSPVYRSAFTIPPVSVPAAPERAFAQTWSHYAITPSGWQEDGTDVIGCAWSSHYPSLLANQGIIDAYEEIPVPRMAVPVSDPGYRGEVFLEGTSGVAYYREWTPNRLTLAVESAGAGFVVVNQNYYPGWRVESPAGRRAEPVRGLIGVPVEPGRQDVVLRYRPASFVWGAWVSGVFCAGLVGWGMWRWRAVHVAS